MHFNELSTDIVQITLSVVLEIVGHAQPIDREQIDPTALVISFENYQSDLRRPSR